MELIIFSTPDGQEVALDREEIRQVWTGQKEGEVVLVMIGDEKIVVVGETDHILKELFDTYDMRNVRKNRRISDKPRLVE